MRLVSISIFVFLILVAYSCKFFRNDKAMVLAEEKARQDSLRIADSIRKSYDLAAREAARIDSLKMEQERLTRENRFNIIVGSFLTTGYARLMMTEYEKKGYSPKIIKPEGSKFELVSAEGHQHYRSALKRLKVFQDSLQANAWIYQVK
jgi:hypothetical protein